MREMMPGIALPSQQVSSYIPPPLLDTTIPIPASSTMDVTVTTELATPTSTPPPALSPLAATTAIPPGPLPSQPTTNRNNARNTSTATATTTDTTTTATTTTTTTTFSMATVKSPKGSPTLPRWRPRAAKDAVDSLCSSLSSLQWLSSLRSSHTGLKKALLSPSAVSRAPSCGRHGRRGGTARRKDPSNSVAAKVTALTSIREGKIIERAQREAKRRQEEEDEAAEMENIDWSTSPRKPPHAYASLIYMALRSSNKEKLALSEIYDYITDHYAYYRAADGGWKNSVRHNLSSSPCFEKVVRSEADKGKGGYWSLAPNHEELAKLVLKRRRRRCKKRGSKGSGKCRGGAAGRAMVATTAAAVASAKQQSSLQPNNDVVDAIKFEAQDLFEGFDWNAALGVSLGGSMGARLLCPELHDAMHVASAASKLDATSSMVVSDIDSLVLSSPAPVDTSTTSATAEGAEEGEQDVRAGLANSAGIPAPAAKANAFASILQASSTTSATTSAVSTAAAAAPAATTVAIVATKAEAKENSSATIVMNNKATTTTTAKLTSGAIPPASTSSTESAAAEEKGAIFNEVHPWAPTQGLDLSLVGRRCAMHAPPPHLQQPQDHLQYRHHDQQSLNTSITACGLPVFTASSTAQMLEEAADGSGEGRIDSIVYSVVGAAAAMPMEGLLSGDTLGCSFLLASISPEPQVDDDLGGTMLRFAAASSNLTQLEEPEDIDDQPIPQDWLE